MDPLPLLHASVLGPLFDYLERQGIACEGSLGRARARLRGAHSLVPLALGGALFEEATAASGLDDLGLRVGAAARIEDVGPLGGLARSAPTVGAAVEAAVRLGSRFNSGERYWLERTGDRVRLHHRFSPALRAGRRQANEFVLMLWLGLIRLAAGRSWRPDEIGLEGEPPGYAAALSAQARRTVHFGQSDTALLFPASLLALSLPAPPPPRAKGGDASGSLPDPEFAGSVRQLVATLLQLGSPHIDAAARAAGTSVRSLQRRLAEARLSFLQVLDQTRCDAAQRMLRDRSTKIIEISAELGYTDSANFTRAFRRWTGLSPRAFRRSVIGGELAHEVRDLRPAGGDGLAERSF